MQAALYARVSTPRQFENNLSHPDQLAQMRRWCEQNGHTVVKEYVEPGDSATDDKRPVFQDMILDAQQKPELFQLIVVHSFSRFFRNLVEATLYERKLAKYGVKMVSITQHTSDDPSGEMQRRMIMLFDEYQSKENGKHTLRGMQENARQGYYNGAKAPFGYKTIATGQTGTRGRIKKKLAIEPAEAEIVREIFELYIGVKGESPRMGMKEIAKTLNGRGLLMRGKLWRVQKVYNILSSSTYAGVHVFNKEDSKTRKVKDKSEWVKVQVPAIIEQEHFDKAAKFRDVYTPMKCKPRREVSRHLLTGLLRCDCCGSTMVLVYGKDERYRYYKCSSRVSKGNTACSAHAYPMNRLDATILDAFRNKIYTPGYIRTVIDDLRRKASKNGGAEKQRAKKLEAELKEIEQAEIKLFEAIEKGVLTLDDRLRMRVEQHKARREAITTELATLQRKHQMPLQTITPQRIEAVSRVIRKRFSASTSFSRAYLKATLREIRVKGDFLNLTGENKAMANLIIAGGNIEPETRVSSFIPVWRPLRDSNPCCLREREAS